MVDKLTSLSGKLEGKAETMQIMDLFLGFYGFELEKIGDQIHVKVKGCGWSDVCFVYKFSGNVEMKCSVYEGLLGKLAFDAMSAAEIEILYENVSSSHTYRCRIKNHFFGCKSLEEMNIRKDILGKDGKDDVAQAMWIWI